MKWSDGSYLEDQDMWCLSGIFRGVHVLAQPAAAHIADYHAATPLVFGADGAVEAALHLEVDVSAAVRIAGCVLRGVRCGCRRQGVYLETCRPCSDTSVDHA
jgi:hypothetical protein